MTYASKQTGAKSVLSQQVRWQQSNSVTNSGIDQTRLAIADAPTGPTPFSFMVMGDTDAGSVGGDQTSPQSFSQAFAEQLMAQLKESRFLLHTGDVTYPMGSYQNYLEGFLRPYQALLAAVPKSPADRTRPVVFNRPLLPVPGNHDYADVRGIARLRSRVLRGVCDRLRQTFGLDLGHYGGQGGEAYGHTFLDDLAKLSPEQLKAHLVRHYNVPIYSPLKENPSKENPFKENFVKETEHCLAYRPGQFTRLPNRYYTFRYGGVDFFALDSNTWNMNPEASGFDHGQLAWLEQRLVASWQTPATVGRIIYLHHSAYTTEESRWSNSETSWMRRHLRAVFDRVSATLGRASGVNSAGNRSPANLPLVDLVLSGHAHCLEHVQTRKTGHADTHMDWVICGGSGAGLRRQRPDQPTDILENITCQGRHRTQVVAQSQLYAGIHGQGAKKQHIHSFIRIDVQPQSPQPFRVLPFAVVRGQNGWQTQALRPLAIGESARCVAAG